MKPKQGKGRERGGCAVRGLRRVTDTNVWRTHRGKCKHGYHHGGEGLIKQGGGGDSDEVKNAGRRVGEKKKPAHERNGKQKRRRKEWRSKGDSFRFCLRLAHQCPTEGKPDVDAVAGGGGCRATLLRNKESK
ncbi:hypothetical protein MRX96_053825 [Rhipicephalus microplus]